MSTYKLPLYKYPEQNVSTKTPIAIHYGMAMVGVATKKNSSRYSGQLQEGVQAVPRYMRLESFAYT